MTAARLRAAGLALALLAATPCVRADDSSSTEERTQRARTLFRKGAELVRRGSWSDALPFLEESARLHPHATTSYDLGYCERILAHYTRARDHFLRALAQNSQHGGSELPPALVAATDGYLVEVESHLARPRVATSGDVAIAVDGRPLLRETAERFIAGILAPGPPEAVATRQFELVLDPGRHELILRGAGGATRMVELDVAPGAAPEVVLPAPTPPRAVVAVGATERATTQRRTWALVLGAVGVSTSVVGAVFAANASASWSAAKDACPARDRCPDDRGASLSATARQDANLATAAFVTGAAATGGALVLWFTAGPTGAHPRVAASVTRTKAGLVLSGSF